MTFRLTTLMYLFALVAASLAAFGQIGVLVVACVLWFWAVALKQPGEGCQTVVAAITLVVVILLLMPAVEMGRSSAQHARCRNNLRQLATSILYFESTFKQLPPAAAPHGETDDVHSWRVRVLPFIESNKLYDSYHFDEPWDGPRNRQVVGSLPYPFYECPSHSHRTETNYFAVTGAQTAWGNGEKRKLEDITDGAENTILLVEVSGDGVHWAEPKDNSFDEAVYLLTTPLPASSGDGHIGDGHRVENGYFFKPSYVRNVAMCNGAVYSLRVPISREAAVALLTANGGEQIDPNWLERQSGAELDYGRVWGFSLFIVLALLPGMPKVRPWVWPQSAKDSALRNPNSAFDQ